MTQWRTLLFALLFAAITRASDQGLLKLVMPDARVVGGIQVARIVASPAGQAIRDQLAAAQPSIAAPAIPISPAEIVRCVQEVVIAVGGPGTNPPTLVIVRTSLDRTHLGPLAAFDRVSTEYEGVKILESAKDRAGALAFLDGGIALFGPSADVKAAIERWHKGVVPAPGTLAKLNEFAGSYDAWVATFGSLPAMPVQLSGAPKKTDILEHLESFSGGIRFSPDFDLTVKLAGRTEKDAEAIADVMHTVRGVIRAAGKESHMENLKLESEGKRFMLSLHVPEKELLNALQQAKTRPPLNPLPASLLGKPKPAVGAPGSPPLGTIRVQSSPSDMGTVLLPTK